jgi:hypothetical protein
VIHGGVPGEKAIHPLRGLCPNSLTLFVPSILRYLDGNVSKNHAEPLPSAWKNEQNGGFGCLSIALLTF